MNVEREKGRTPLMFSSAMGDVEMVDILLRGGAKRQKKSKNGWTAATLASLYGRDEVYDLLEGPAENPAAFSRRLTVNTVPGVVPAQLIEQVPAEYTDDALTRGIEGQVALRVAVLADGRVGAIELEEGVDVGLDLNAIEAIRQWKFQPATRAGRPISSVIEAVAVFSLPD